MVCDALEPKVVVQDHAGCWPCLPNQHIFQMRPHAAHAHPSTSHSLSGVYSVKLIQGWLLVTYYTIITTMEYDTSTNHFSKWPEIFSECLHYRPNDIKVICGVGYSAYGGFYSTTKHKRSIDVHFIFKYPQKSTYALSKIWIDSVNNIN